MVYTHIAGVYQTSDSCPSLRRLFSLLPRIQTPQTHTPENSQSNKTIMTNYAAQASKQCLTLLTTLYLSAPGQSKTGNCAKLRKEPAHFSLKKAMRNMSDVNNPLLTATTIFFLRIVRIL